MDYRKLTRSLITKVRTLWEEVGDLEERTEGLKEDLCAYQAPCMACEHLQEVISQQDSTIQGLEGELRDAQDRSHQVQDAVGSLERARGFGDDWGMDRAVRRLKGL